MLYSSALGWPPCPHPPPPPSPNMGMSPYTWDPEGRDQMVRYYCHRDWLIGSEPYITKSCFGGSWELILETCTEFTGYYNYP